MESPLIEKLLEELVYTTPLSTIAASLPSIFVALLEASVTSLASVFRASVFNKFLDASLPSDFSEKSVDAPVAEELKKIRPLFSSKLAFSPTSRRALTASRIVLSLLNLMSALISLPSLSFAINLSAVSSSVNPSSESFVEEVTFALLSDAVIFPPVR